MTPLDRLLGRQEEIWAARDRKLEQARERRKAKRKARREVSLASAPNAGGSSATT